MFPTVRNMIPTTKEDYKLENRGKLAAYSASHASRGKKPGKLQRELGKRCRN